MVDGKVIVAHRGGKGLRVQISQRYQIPQRPSMSSFTTTTRLLHSRPQKPPLNTDIKEISRSILVDGVERVLSYGGTSQYSNDGKGASACGLAALNFARIVFSIEQGGLKNTDLLQAVLARECVEVRRRLYPIPLSEHILISILQRKLLLYAHHGLATFI